jgi:putative CocE/NonD family hydrolase
MPMATSSGAHPEPLVGELTWVSRKAEQSVRSGRPAHRAPVALSNMRAHDRQALTYTTPPLDAPVDVAGHPIVYLWLSTDAPDLDAFVYLEEVDVNANSTYVTQGNLRGSHRRLSPAPFESFGLPWHNHFKSELEPIPAGDPMELVFDLLPTAWHFPAGKHIRITVAFADSGNFATPIFNPAPQLRVLRDGSHASYVELPVVR